MAHNLATINGRVAMAYQGETPWHKLGIRLESMTSVPQALKAANLDWTVGAQPVYLKDGRMVPGRRAIVRDGDNAILNTVGSLYNIIQNSDAFDLLSPACERHGVTIESAGALGQGERVWMLAKMPGSIAPVAGDDINGYFLVTSGHGDDIAYTARFTPVRVVCQNTLSAATSSGVDTIRLPHLPGVDRRLTEATKLVEKMIAAMKETGATFAQLAQKRMTKADVIAYIETVFPATKSDDGQISKQLADKRASVARLVWEGRGAALAGADAKGATAWACYNAVTEYFDHVATALGTKGQQARANESAVFGAYAKVKRDALVAARELVAA